METISKRDAIELVQLNYSYREARDFVWQTTFSSRFDEKLQIRKAIKLNEALRLVQDKTGIEAISHRMFMSQFYELLKSL
jgi:hypothetical protein